MDKKTNKDLDNFNAVLKKKHLIPASREQIRGLQQYAKMTDEEFEEFYNKRTMGIEVDAAWEKRILQKLAEFEDDYDLNDLKINDKYSLRALVSAVLRLEDYDVEIGRITSEGITDSNIYLLDKIAKLQEGLRGDIAQLQEGLKISRKSRKADKEESVMNFLEDLKLKAKKFYDAKMLYVYCPKCNNLLATIWTLYPDFKGNKIFLHCAKELESGNSCNTNIEISLKTLYSKRSASNNDEIMPESMR